MKLRDLTFNIAAALLALTSLQAGAPRSPVNQVFQFAHSGEIVYDEGTAPKKATLYLWVPEKCEKLRGLVIMATNVPEHMLAGHEAIRAACRENDLGLVWGVPTFWHFAREMKGRDAEQVAFLQQLLNGLAEKSGYAEIATVPWLPVGESGHLLMVCGLINQRPEHCIAGICVKNPHYPDDRTVPLLWTLGTAQEWGQKEKDIRKDWNGPTDGEFEVNATLLDTIPDGFVGAGEKLSATPGKPVVEWICGPFAPTVDGKFCVALDRTWKTGAASYLIGRQDGTATVRPSVQPAAVKLLENKEGVVQKITFAPVGPLQPDSAPVTLSATSDAGLPVEFVVLSGPAIIKNGQLVLAPIPPRARFPAEVVVAAWQWGRASEPKVRTADMVRQTLSIQKPGAALPPAR